MAEESTSSTVVVLRKIARTAAWTVAFIVAFCILLAMGIRGKWEYTRGYSNAKWSELKKGMTQAEVRTILGKPFEEVRTENRLYMVRIASGEVKPVLIRYYPNGNASAHDFNDPIVKNRGISFSHTKKQIEGSLHTTESTLHSYQYYWRYSRSRGLTLSTHTREITFDHNQLIAYIEQTDVED